MITITRRGEIPIDKTYKATCTRCATRFTFTKADADVSSCRDDAGTLIVVCPLPGCDTKVYRAP